MFNDIIYKRCHPVILYKMCNKMGKYLVNGFNNKPIITGAVV